MALFSSGNKVMNDKVGCEQESFCRFVHKGGQSFVEEDDCRHASRPLSRLSSPEHPHLLSSCVEESKKLSPKTDDGTELPKVGLYPSRDRATVTAVATVSGPSDAAPTPAVPQSYTSKPTSEAYITVNHAPLETGAGETLADTPVDVVKTNDWQTPKLWRVAAKGVFSRRSSLDVLQQSKHSQRSSRHMESAGWTQLEPSPMRADSLDEGIDTATQPELQVKHPKENSSGTGSLAGTTAEGVQGSVVRHPPFVARVCERDAAAASEAVKRREGFVDTETHAVCTVAPHPQQRQNHHNWKRTQPPLGIKSPRVHSRGGGQGRGDHSNEPHHPSHPRTAWRNDPMRDISPYAMRTAASVERISARQPPVGRAPHLLSADGSQEATASGTARTAVNGHLKTSVSRPRRLDISTEKGQQRRPSAEPACDRGNDGGGEASRAGVNCGDREPRKLSMMPPPRGYDAYVQRGLSLREKRKCADEQRRIDDIVNCTHHPRVNRHGNVAGPSQRSASAARPASYPPISSVATAGKAAAPAFFPPTMSAPECHARRMNGRDKHFLTRHNRAPTSIHGSAYPTPSSLTAREVGAASLRMGAAAQGKMTPKETTACHSAAGASRGKKSKAEIEQHLEQMMRRDQERLAKWKMHLAMQASEQEESRAEYTARRPKTDELAERARARYRMQEELTKHPVQHEGAQRSEVLAKKMSRQIDSGRRAPASPRRAYASKQDVGTGGPGTEPTIKTAVRMDCNTAREFHGHQVQAEMRRKRHLEQLRLNQAEEELRECTFRPRLNSASERMTQRFVVKSTQTNARNADRQSATRTPPWEEMIGSDGVAESASQSPKCHDNNDCSSPPGLPDNRPLQDPNRMSPMSNSRVLSTSARRPPHQVECEIDTGTGLTLHDGSIESSTRSFADNIGILEVLSREGAKQSPRLSVQLGEGMLDVHEKLCE